MGKFFALAFASLLLVLALVSVPRLCSLLLDPLSDLRWDWSRIDTNDVTFPPSFLWGTATAAHQIEGGNENNNWSEFEKREGVIVDGSRCGSACDHWRLYKEDVQLMKNLGVGSYRFSIEWSRVEPEQGRFDEEAFARYLLIVDELLAQGIEPVLTLFHFTYPIWFGRLGGFEKETNLVHLLRFASEVFARFHTRVTKWCTVNEAEVFTLNGWSVGIFPPGKKDPALAAEVLKNLLEAHVLLYSKLKTQSNNTCGTDSSRSSLMKSQQDNQCQIGFVKSIFQFDPYNPYNPLDWIVSYLMNDVFTYSVIRFFQTGTYVFWQPGVVHLQHTNHKAMDSMDFIGLNYYSHYFSKFQMDLKEPFKMLSHPKDAEFITDMGYPVYPEGFFRAIKQVSQLNKPIYITENGVPDHKDQFRDLFIRRYMYSLFKAMEEGADVRGYFYWSLMDNWEWNLGYEMRFGLYHVDFENQVRTLKNGSRALIDIIKKSKN